MLSRISFTLNTLVAAATVIPRQYSSECKCFTDDICWPSTEEWKGLNSSVGGNLIATIPVGAPCHKEEFGPYDADQCQRIRDAYFESETHESSSSSVMMPCFTNSCNPFLDQNQGCTLGNFVAYAVRVRDARDVQATVRFVNQFNIRLVIKNTGHDYHARSTGASALSIWTRDMNHMEMIEGYKSSSFQGRAVRLGAGVRSLEALAFADSQGAVVVTGNCPTTGIVGGVAQGGGLGRLVSKYGLAADQTLKWEVVTSRGDLVLARSDNEHAELYWALSGGGAGTYAIAVSLTVKAYEPVEVSAANLSFSLTNTNRKEFFDVVGVFQSSLSSLVDRGMVAHWLILPQTFLLSPLTAPGVTSEELDSLMRPTLEKLKECENVPFEYHSGQYASALEAYNAIPVAPATVADVHIGSRLIPRGVVADGNHELVGVVETIVERGIIVSGVAFNVSQAVPDTHLNAAQPYFRDSIINLSIGCGINFTQWEQNEVCRSGITDTLRDVIAPLDQQGGAYGNEADYRQPDWKTLFYGPHYDRLDKIKSNYGNKGLYRP